MATITIKIEDQPDGKVRVTCDPGFEAIQFLDGVTAAYAYAARMMIAALSDVHQRSVLEITDIALSKVEIERLTGFTQPRRQVDALRERGFWRAALVRGECLLEREHFKAVCRGTPQQEERPRVRDWPEERPRLRPRVKP